MMDEQRLARPPDRLRVLALLRRQRGVEEQAGHPDHAIHRRANLVAHGREKGALGPRRRLGLDELRGHRRVQRMQAVNQVEIEQRQDEEADQQTQPHRNLVVPVIARNQYDREGQHRCTRRRVQVAGTITHPIADDDPQVQRIEARTELAHHVHAERDHAQVAHDHGRASADEVPGRRLTSTHPRHGKQAVCADASTTSRTSSRARSPKSGTESSDRPRGRHSPG